MRAYRYAIQRQDGGEYLRDVLALRGDDGHPIVVGVTWTTDPAQTMRWQGVKSAAHMARELGERKVYIINKRGRVVRELVF